MRSHPVRDLRPRDPRPLLSSRDRDMIHGVMAGKTNKIIAYDLGLSERTVKVYMSRLYPKLGVSNRCQLFMYGVAYTRLSINNDHTAE